MRSLALLVLVGAAGCIDLDALGRLNDLSVPTDEGPGDMGIGDMPAPGSFVWVPASTGTPASQAQAVVVDPVTTTNVYAAMVVGGVYRSRDGGATWSQASTGLPSTVQVNALAIDPTAPGTLYAGTNANGVYKTTDGANTWSPANLAFSTAPILSLALDSSAPQTIFAGEISGIIKSVDGGAHWTASGEGLPTGGSVHGLAIAHASPNLMLATEYGGQGVYQSVDGGAHWKAFNTGLGDLHAYAVAIDPGSATNFYVSTATGVYHCSNGLTWVATTLTQPVQWLAFDPSASTTVYAAAFSVGIFRTGNGGISWTALATGNNASLAVGVAVDPSASPTVYAACFGVDKSNNSGGAFSPSTGINDTIVSVLTADPLAAVGAYGGTPYLGQVIHTTLNTPSWSLANTGLSGAGSVTAIAVDTMTPTNLYAGTQLAGLVKSTNRGGAWSPMNTGLAAGEPVSAVAVDPNASANVYVGMTSSGLYRSVDGAGSFSPVATGLGTIRAIVVEAGTGAVYAAGDGGFDGGTGGGLVRSADGVNFESAVDGLTTNRVEALIADGAGNLYAGTNGGGVFRSTDGATSWSPINSGISNTAIIALAVDPYAPAVLYAAAVNAGVYQSRNAGQTWTRQVAGLATLDVLSLAVTTDGVVLAGTAGYGVFMGSGQ